MTALELLEKYAKEAEIDTQIDAVNVLEKQFSAPNVAHKWNYRWIQAGKKLIELRQKRDSMVNDALENDNPAKLNKAIIKAKVENSKEMKELQKDIAEYELLEKYLDRCLMHIFGSSSGFTYKNIIDLLKREEGV